MFSKIALGLIGFYQKVVSPMFKPHCRFYPTCSEYGRQAILKYGILKGGFLSLIRLMKCHPFHSGGHDPLT